MRNVASMFGGPTGIRTRNESVIEVLRELLEKAEAGEIVGVITAQIYHDGLSGFRIGGLVGSYSMVGALEMAKADLINVIIE